MKASVEVSLYPLAGDYLAVIEKFINRLNTYPQLRVVTNTMSTQVFGDYDEVLSIVHAEMQKIHARVPAAPFVVKVLGGDLSPDD